ncbi:MAG: glycerol-3-phosphate dehydrogenase [Flavobacteriales bacterium]|jgi:glycerol-3-phosphate dehydrogenase
MSKPNKPYDVIIIGAGIHGAGIAQTCAINGLKVAIIEKAASAAMGTSSKSSKLIHGGLRYLETGELGLVRECLKERRQLLTLAPKLVHSRRFFIPLSKHLKRHPLIMYCGLLAYWLFSGAHRSERPTWFSKSKLKAIFPKIQTNNGALSYYDAQTDDKKLTEAVLTSALEHGCELFLNTKLKGATRNESTYTLYIEGIDETEALECKCMVNAAGPWVNEIAALITPSPAKQNIALVQGTHIILDIPAPHECIYCEHPSDQRAAFILPWQGKTLVGTTEKSFKGKPDECHESEEEIDYLLELHRHYFPSFSASRETISRSFCGLRVLPEGNGPEHKKTRETVILSHNSNPEYIAVYGGKLTAYRLTAERVCLHIAKALNKKFNRSTKSYPLA